MTLRFEIFGFEIAKLELDLPEDSPSPEKVLDKGIKAMSRWWVRGMAR